MGDKNYSFEPFKILEELQATKIVLDNLTKELAEITRKKCEVEEGYNKATLKEIEVARQEKVPATLIKDVVKSRLAEKLFEVRILETKEAYILNRLRNERSNVEILRTILSYKKEEMKDL